MIGEADPQHLQIPLAATRHISKPMSVMVDGPSSGGKSELIKRITKLLPPHFIRELQSMSERALAYVGDMRNQILVVYELGGLGNEGKESLEMMKQLLTEGCIKRQIAESTPQGVRGRLIEVEGPTGLWTTTTKVVTDHELNNRLFKITVDDSQDQTRGIIRNVFVEDRAPVDYEPFLAHHVWLEGQDNRVTLPFGKALGEKMLDSAVRMRRDAARVRDLICAHAVLHQVTRERDSEGRIIATLEDYEVIRSLIDNIIGVAAEKSVSPTVRETVNLAQELIDNEEPVTRISLGKKLGIDKTTAGRRLGAAKSGGYLKHNEDAEGSQKEYVIGDPLPDKKLALPTKEALAETNEGCRGASDSGREGQGQNHDENCSDASCTVDAPVHAPPDDTHLLEEPEPLTYQEFSSEEGTETAEPPLSEIPCTPCTPHGEECLNPEECMHPCVRSASPDQEEAWEQIVVLWEHEKATQHIDYMNDSHETDPYTWAASVPSRRVWVI